MDDYEEKPKMYGPQSWYGIDADPVGLKHTLWLEVMSEFKCKAVSTWPSCDDQKNMAFNTRDSGKDLEEREKFMEETTNILHEGRQAVAKRFYIAGDLDIELGLLCTVDYDVEELSDMYGPQCWQDCDADPRNFKIDVVRHDEII